VKVHRKRPRNHGPRFAIWSAIAFALFLGVSSAVQQPQKAAALPTFAQAYQVDCSMCHSMVPALNAYGRYVQSSAFGVLDARVMERAIPLVMRESISYRSTGKLDAQQPAYKFTEANVSLNLVGVLSNAFSYRLEQSFYSNNISNGTTGHFWVSYNQLFHADGHLKIGKFDAPAPPAFSYWQDMSGFSSPSISVGQHGYALSGDRWGVGLDYVPRNYQKQPYKAEFAYVGNSPVLYNDTIYSMSNPYGPGGSTGSDKAYEYKVAYARPDKPVEAGVYGAVGSYVLPSGYLQPIDNYNATGVYAQRDQVKMFPGVLAFYQQTSDSNVGPGKASNQLVQSAISRAWSVEFDESFFGGNVMLGVRPVEYLSGLQASKAGYDTLQTGKPHYGVFDIVARDPKFSPYLYLTIESAVAAATNATYGQPAWRVGLTWAVPLFRPFVGREPTPPATFTPADLQAGTDQYAQNCAACHGADGKGGIGPNLHSIYNTTSLKETVALIENPIGVVMPRLYPATLTDAQVQQVAAYVRATFR
jgi:mono/diheme cytochrome c family protein